MCTARWSHPSLLVWKEQTHTPEIGTVSLVNPKREELAEGVTAFYRCWMDRHLCYVIAQRDMETRDVTLRGMPFQGEVIRAGQTFLVADPAYPPRMT
ncbi:MAG: hypothetical protein ABIG71_00085 [Candidatus Uhrbacteria bacterium]